MIMPKVSVSVVTYNHELYIEDCLNSLLKQTYQDFEIIVSDDCSNDRTRELVDRFALKYPEKIIRNYQVENVGPTKNYYSSIAMCSGVYIAHLDGDDLVCPNKLGRQVEILDSNPTVSFVTHTVDVFEGEISNVVGFWPDKNIGEITKGYLIRNAPYFCHSSKMFRRSANVFLESGENIIDCFLHFEHASKGDVIHLNERLGFYRKGVGISFDRKSEYHIRLYEKLMHAYDRAEELNYNLNDISYGRAQASKHFALMALDEGDFSRFYTLMGESFNYQSFISLGQVFYYCMRHFSYASIYFRKLKLKLNSK